MQLFASGDRYFPPLNRVTAHLDALPRARVDGVFWLLALLGTLPALRAELLFPFDWWLRIVAGLALDDPANTFGWVFGLAAVLAVLTIAAAQRNAWRLLAVLPLVLVALADSTVGDVVPGLDGAYAVAAFAVWLYFVVVGRTRSLYFGLYTALLCLAHYSDASLTWSRVVTFVLMSVAASLVYETWRQNRPMLRQLGRENVAALLWRAFSLWSPTIVLIAIGLTLGSLIQSSTEELVYEGTFVERFCRLEGERPELVVPCPAEGDVLATDAFVEWEDLRDSAEPLPVQCMVRRYYDMWTAVENDVRAGPRPPAFECPTGYADGASWAAEPLPFHVSLDRSVDRSFAVMEWETDQRLRRIDRGAFDRSRDAGAEARLLFGVVPETPGITIQSCEWYDLPCHIVGMVKRSLINAYVRVRTRTERNFVNAMQARADALSAGVSEGTRSVEAEIDEAIGEWNRQTREALAGMYTAYNLVDIVLKFWILVIAIKSFLYVFARVIFDRKTRVDVELADDDTIVREGRVAHVQEVNVSGSYPYDLYYKSNYQPLGPAPRFSIPQPGASLLSRLRFGAWNLAHVPMPCDDERGVTFNSVQADHLVDWEMVEGEEVIFSYGNFVAMNENVELRTVVSLRVASLLMGRFVFHAARCTGGPGRLVLRTRGRPATAKQVRQSIPVTRLVAWNRYAQFSVDSHLTRTDVFLNGFNLRRSDGQGGSEPQGILVVEADARDGGVLFGTLRFAKHFLLPV